MLKVDAYATAKIKSFYHGLKSRNFYSQLWIFDAYLSKGRDANTMSGHP